MAEQVIISSGHITAEISAIGAEIKSIKKNGEEIIDLLKLSNRNLEQTILLITHDEKIALEADRVITIEDGKIVGDQKRR